MRTPTPSGHDTTARGTVRTIVAAALLAVAAAGCDSTQMDTTSSFRYDFSPSTHGWEAFFAGYPVGWRDKMELTAGHRPLPSSVEASGKGLFIRGVNHSDNVKMLFRRKVDGLAPNATYSARFTVRFATNAPSDCGGIGGAPGQGVKVIAAATRTRPEEVVIDDPEPAHRLNVQHQADDPQAWYQGSIIGHIGNSRDCESEPVFELKTLRSESAHDSVTTNAQGEAWLLFGTRSGFEGPTALYYSRVEAHLDR